MKFLSLLILPLLFLISCGEGGGEVDPDVTDTLVAYDLSAHGIPVTLDAPGGATPKKGFMSGAMDGFQVYDLNLVQQRFALNVMMIDDEVEPGMTAALLHTESMRLNAEVGAFEIISEDSVSAVFKTEHGFSFQYTMLKNGREISFSSAILGGDDITQAEAEEAALMRNRNLVLALNQSSRTSP